MIPVHDLFESHLTVTDLNRAIDFYRDVVGLRLAHVTSERRAAFSGSELPGTECLGCGLAQDLSE
jgi:catechol 2,3-dioxygenase-like lactoylglutathione lyase family enzyme